MSSKKFTAAAAGLVIAALAGVWSARPGAATRVEIPEGLSARQTAELLGDVRVVHSAFAFRVFIKLTGFDRHLKPGVYTLRVHEWPTTTARKLTLGLTDALRVTIPEGFTAKSIAERLAVVGIVNAEEFSAVVKKRNLEGRLFPGLLFLLIRAIRTGRKDPAQP